MVEQHGHTPHEKADAARALAARRGRRGGLLPAALSRARAGTPADPGQWAPQVGRALGLPAAAGLGPATYFADFAAPHGERHVRMTMGALTSPGCDSTPATACRAGSPSRVPRRGVVHREHERGTDVVAPAGPGGGQEAQECVTVR